MPSSETGSPPILCVGESGVTSSGCSRLDRPQLVEQRVVLVVPDLGIVKDVVAVVVVFERAPELRSPALSASTVASFRPRAHGCSSLAAGAISRSRSYRRSAARPVAIGEVEVDRGDRDLALSHRGEVGPVSSSS